MDNSQQSYTFHGSRPNVAVDLATVIAQQYYGKTTVNIRELKSHQDRNFYFDDSNGQEYVLKILECDDDQDERPELTNSIKAMQWLDESGFVVPRPLKGINTSFIEHYKREYCTFRIE